MALTNAIIADMTIPRIPYTDWSMDCTAFAVAPGAYSELKSDIVALPALDAAMPINDSTKTTLRTMRTTMFMVVPEERFGVQCD